MGTVPRPTRTMVHKENARGQAWCPVRLRVHLFWRSSSRWRAWRSCTSLSDRAPPSPATPRSCCASTTTCTRSAQRRRRQQLFEGNRPSGLRGVLEALRKAKVDPRVKAVLIVPGRPEGAALGQGAGGPRRDPRLPQVGQAGRRVPRVRRRARVLHRHRVRQDLPDAEAPPRPQWPGHLRGVPARHARQDRPLPDFLHIGDYKTAYNAFTEKGYTKAHREVDRVDDARSVRSARARHRRRPQEDRRPTCAR